MFGPIRKVLKVCRFESEEDIKAMVTHCFQQQPREVFVERFHWLVHSEVAKNSMHRKQYHHPTEH
jgi:hypothetical protein